MSLVGQGEPQRIEGATGDWRTCSLLLGRPGARLAAISRSGGRPGGRSPGTVVLSYGLWQSSVRRRSRRASGSRSLSTTRPYTVIGVTPARLSLSHARGAVLDTPFDFKEEGLSRTATTIMLDRHRPAQARRIARPRRAASCTADRRPAAEAVSERKRVGRFVGVRVARRTFGAIAPAAQRLVWGSALRAG